MKMRGVSCRSCAALAVLLSVPALASGPGGPAAPVGPRTLERTARVESCYAALRTGKGATPLQGAGPSAADTAAAKHRLEEAAAKSAACGTLYGIAITPAMLQAELDRMGRETTSPATLRTLFAALGDDADAAAEALARPLLADRLLRAAYSADRSLHGRERREAEAALADLKAGRGWPVCGGRRTSILVGDDPDGAPGDPTAPRWDDRGRRVLSTGEWRSLSPRWPSPGAPPCLVETDEGFSVRLARAGAGGEISAEALTFAKRPFDEWWNEVRPRFSAATPRRQAGSYHLPEIGEGASCGDLAVLPGQPSARTRASFVWTGTELIFWGGESLSSDARGSGGRFDPVTGAYRPLAASPSNINQAIDSVAVWAGTVMGVFTPSYWDDMGFNAALYDPVSDTWTQIPQGPGCPKGLRTLTAVWTGREIAVWGSAYTTSGGGTFYAAGGLYDPASGKWRPMSAVGAPTPRTNHAAVWTGREMVVFGGSAMVPGDYSQVTGGRYDPGSDTWRPTSVQLATPEAGAGFSCVWTGAEMIVWGGAVGTSSPGSNAGGRYNPVTDSWTATDTAGAPELRYGHTAVWTGREMIVWGGMNRGADGIGQEVALDTGGRYDPARDRWTPTPTGGLCPAGRTGHVAVWTGSAMLVWSGIDYTSGYSNRKRDGALFDPAQDAWLPLLLGAADTERNTWMVSVWTGAEFIVWGGQNGTSNMLQTGAVYEPATGSWRPTALDWNTPSARYGCTAVWTGSEMIIWGGTELGSIYNPAQPTWSGGRYDPVLDRWKNTSTGPRTPLPRWGHSAAWTGKEMVVWGGQGQWYAFYNTGGRYDPVADRWVATPTSGPCPSPRMAACAIWTGTEMIVWGGRITDFKGQEVPLGDGGRYSPTANAWTALPSGGGSPSARAYPAAVWTGDMMVVWGGTGWGSTPDTGARFYPAASAWQPTSTAGAPTMRISPVELWTGTRVAVWGGSLYGPNSNGALYDPDADAWEALPDPGPGDWSTAPYVGAPADPLLFFRGGERAGWTIEPCLSARAMASKAVGTGAGVYAFAGFAAGGDPPYAFEWDFGDGTPRGSGENPDHTYASPGTYTFTLTVSDGKGAQASQTKSLTVIPPPGVSSVRTLASPFRLAVEGTGFQPGARVSINGTDAPATTVASSTQIEAGRGAALKSLLPKGTQVTVRVTNPDGQSASTPFTRSAAPAGGAP